MREELDFKSLRFFSALYRLGNVSPAADALNISQPTGSLLLKKLRDHFADPLFVRVGQRMMPTPRADAIAPTVFTLLQLADNDLAVKPEFLPQQSQRNFTIGMTDISQMTLLPLLQIALQQQAADGITFTVQNLDEQTLNALESDMIAVVPEQVARHITRRYPCRSWPLPFPLARIAIRQVWHQRLHRDPGHIWLRSLIAALADPAQQSGSITI